MNPIDTFIAVILRADHLTLRQVAWHEAGHRFFWKAAFPNIATIYVVKDGFPAVIRWSGNNALRLEHMDNAEAARYACIKLGGIAAEILLFGLAPAAEMIADFISSDFYTSKSGIDWKDDQEHGGDVSSAIRIIEARAGRQSVKVNFNRILRLCVDNLLANRAEFEIEAQEAFTLFRQWHDRGMFRL